MDLIKTTERFNWLDSGCFYVKVQISSFLWKESPFSIITVFVGLFKNHFATGNCLEILLNFFETTPDDY